MIDIDRDEALFLKKLLDAYVDYFDRGNEGLLKNLASAYAGENQIFFSFHASRLIKKLNAALEGEPKPPDRACLKCQSGMRMFVVNNRRWLYVCSTCGHQEEERLRL